MSNTSITQPPVIPNYDDCRSPKSLGKFFELLRVTFDNYFLHHPASHTMFVTLTFDRNIRCPKQAHKHLKSLNNKIRNRYGGYIWVMQRQYCGRIHYHLVIPAGFDCHDGTALEDWSAGRLDTPNQKRDSLNSHLKAEWDWWQAKAATHGFGRAETAPVYSTAEAVRNYLLTRPTGTQLAFLPKHTRFWGSTREFKSGTTVFSWVNGGAREGRLRMAAWAATYGCTTREEVRELLGRKWGYMFLWDTQAERESSIRAKYSTATTTSAPHTSSPSASTSGDLGFSTT